MIASQHSLKEKISRADWSLSSDLPREEFSRELQRRWLDLQASQQHTTTHGGSNA
jgi:hypothetical protein